MNQESMADAPVVQPGHSRRNFIKGVIAAGATVSASAYLFRTTILGQNEASLPGSVERLITLDVNGQQRRVDVLKHETLATTLRYKLGLTGTKLGCDRAECGACTVLVDDVPHYSCSILTHSVRGKKVRDASKASPSPTARCTRCSRRSSTARASSARSACPASSWRRSGILKTNPNPTRDELAHGISGNLCRCADYNKILDCMMNAAELARGA